KFVFAHDLDRKKSEPYYQSAQKIKTRSSEIRKKIQDLNTEMIAQTEGLTIAEADTIHLEFVEKKEQYTESTNLMVGANDDISKGKARELRLALEEYEGLIKSELRKNGVEVTAGLFNFKPKERDGHQMQWEKYTYYDLPLAAVIAYHHKLSNDVLQHEYNSVGRLLGEIATEDFPIDTVVAQVIPKSNYLIQGQPYEAQVFVGGYSTTTAPKMYITDANGQEVLLDVSNGSGNINLASGTQGIFDYKGKVEVTNNSGQVKTFPFSSSYVVAAPTATVSATAMNVLYKGIDNPIEISVPGVPDDKVRATINNGSRLQKQSTGKYIAKLNNDSNNESKITVQAELDGEWVTMNIQTFRVKNLPPPRARVGRILSSGRMKSNELEIQSMILDYSDDFIFDLDRPRLVSFKVLILGGDESRERTWTKNKWFQDDLGAFIRSAKPGQNVVFKDIKAIGPDDKEHILSNVMVTIIR
ncbi:MAG: GldM family protein, partial [Flavobacteriales bacterium]